MGLINFFIVKMLVKTKFANIINISAKEEIIPELIQSNCNPNNIFKFVSDFLDNPDKIRNQVNRTEAIIKNLKTDQSSTKMAAQSIIKFL